MVFNKRWIPALALAAWLPMAAQAALTVGAPAPDFSADAAVGGTVSGHTVKRSYCL